MRESIPPAPAAGLERLGRWVSVPRNTLLIVFIGVLLFMFGPLIFAGIRYGILRMKVSDPEKLEALNRDTKNNVMVYRQLQRDAWPMTKLLGDIANAMPDGVEVESLQIAYGEDVLIKGIAKPFEPKSTEPGAAAVKRTATDELIRMENLLRSTRIFTGSQSKWDPEEAHGQRKFQITASIVNPTRVVGWDPTEDFAKVSARDRKYPNWREIEKGSGGASSNTSVADATAAPAAPPATENTGTEQPATPPAVAETALAAAVPEAPPPTTDREGAGEFVPPDAVAERGVGRRSRADAPKEDGGGAGGEAATGGRPTQPPAAAPADVPAPITDEELKAMSKTEAQALLGKLSTARQKANVDEETKNRLREDFKRVLDHVKSIK